MKILTLTTPDVENGLGCRVTLWFAGCSHHCEGCHNKHTWDYNQGKNLLNKQVLDKIFEEVDKPYIKGITLSGGDPLDQSDENLLKLDAFLLLFKEKFKDKDIWIYSGGIYEELKENTTIKNILKKCDVLVDGPFKKELYNPDLPFRGSTNQTIWENKNGEFVKSELN